MSEQNALPTPGLTAEQRTTIAEVLASRGAQGPCPACHENSWVIGHGHSLLTIGADDEGGAGLPVVSRICSNCGYISLHATVVLGI